MGEHTGDESGSSGSFPPEKTEPEIRLPQSREVFRVPEAPGEIARAVSSITRSPLPPPPPRPPKPTSVPPPPPVPKSRPPAPGHKAKVTIAEKLKGEARAARQRLEGHDMAIDALRTEVEALRKELTRLSEQLRAGPPGGARPSSEEPGANKEQPKPKQSASSDDLTRIRGVGPKTARSLRSAGVTAYEQMAAWSPEDIKRISKRIGISSDRIRKGHWVESARKLAKG